MGVLLTGAENHWSEVRVIDRIGIFLSFYDKRAAEIERLTVGAVLGAEEEVSAVELKARLVGKNFDVSA